MIVYNGQSGLIVHSFLLALQPCHEKHG